jgi:2-polyprenyl-3-methyl-5-hydroxy-6-metoxy-1,4-benzoquinol methylase
MNCDLQLPVCPLCADERLRRIYEVVTWHQYGIEKCRNCGFVFALPRPTAEELDHFYTSAYFERSQSTPLGYANYRAIAEINARLMWREMKVLLDRYSARPRRLLDVGCATGGFLAEAQADLWECLGVELSDFAIDVARREFGLQVLKGDVFHTDIRVDSFGLVTMWHVLEHIIDPLSTLVRVRELLAPNGLLFIELPNWASVGRRARGAKWSQLKPPEHINFFTPRSLAAAVHRAGFRVLKAGTSYPSLMNEALVRRQSRPLHMVKAGLAAIASYFGGGGYVRVLAQKG